MADLAADVDREEDVTVYDSDGVERDPSPVEPEPEVESEQASEEVEPGGSEEPSAGPELDATPPSYMSRAEFDEAMSGVSGHYQQQIDQQARQIHQMNQMMSMLQNQLQPKPEEKPIIPPRQEFENLDVNGLHSVIKNMHKTFDSRIQEAEQRYQNMLQQQQQERVTQQWTEYFKQQTDAAVNSNPIFKDPAWRNMLERQVVAEMQANKADWRRVNVSKTAAEIAGMVSALAEQRYKEKAGAASARGPAAAAPRGPGSTPPKGTATRPGKTKKPVTSIRDMEDALTPELERLYEGMMGR